MIVSLLRTSRRLSSRRGAICSLCKSVCVSACLDFHMHEQASRERRLVWNRDLLGPARVSPPNLMANPAGLLRMRYDACLSATRVHHHNAKKSFSPRGGLATGCLAQTCGIPFAYLWRSGQLVGRCVKALLPLPRPRHPPPPPRRRRDGVSLIPSPRPASRRRIPHHTL